MALKGDTVRLEVKFMDFDGNEVEPIDIILNIYDENNMAIQSISMTDDNKVSIGSYFYDYVIPYTANDFIVYEFIGNYKGKPKLARDKIHVEFV